MRDVDRCNLRQLDSLVHSRVRSKANVECAHKREQAARQEIIRLKQFARKSKPGTRVYTSVMELADELQAALDAALA